MELIVKPTVKCNFKCSFCSSTVLSDNAKDQLELRKIKAFLKRFPNTETIIVNGGDPLMMSPDYYWRMIEILDEGGYTSNISFTSNLWPFYKNPKKWAPLFRHPRVGVTTSFNYGNTRLKGDLTVFTEEDFWKTSDAMLEHVGYRPDFISVITEENEATALDNVRLAQRMSDGVPAGKNEFGEKVGVECKLNYAMASGPVQIDPRTGHQMGQEGKPYLLSKIYQIYLEVHREGLTPWEFNTKQMTHRLFDERTICPQSRKCDENIRVLHPDGEYFSCGSFGDDREKPIDFVAEVRDGKFFTPLQDSPELVSMKAECLSCPLFAICNGCRKTVKDLKTNNMVEEHCKLMKTLGSELIDINFGGSAA